MTNHISVIMSVKNGEKYLTRAAKSILNQTFKNFEFIIVNNDSIDDTQLILENLAKEDSRIKIINNSNNENPSQGRMTGIKNAKYEWIALMDADDECHPERLEKQVNFIVNTEIKNLGVISTYGKYINSQNKVIANFYSGPINIKEFKNLHLNNDGYGILDPSSIIKKDVFLNVGGYLNQTFAYDLDLYYKIAESGYVIQSINLPLYFYRVHAGSYSVKHSMKQREVTHFINFNMRQRRNGKKEISDEEFNKKFWKRLYYRFPRQIHDLAMTNYKISGYSFMEKKIIRFLFFLVLSFMLSPRYVFKKLFVQFIKKNV